jgi:FtsZ-binding cell division protein ZapB
VTKRPIVASVKDGLEKLSRETAQLQREVAALTQRLSKFKKKHPLPRRPYLAGLEWYQSPETREPRSAIKSVEGDPNDLANVPALMFAMSNDLDGALRDIRAARADIDAIVNDSDLRSEFRNWQDRS